MRQRIQAVAAATASPGPEPIVLVGFFRTHLGIAQCCRILAEALQDSGIATRRIDASDVIPHDKTEDFQAREDLPAGGTLVLGANPPELYKVFRHFGPDICAGRRLVGYWWWELDRLPADWRSWGEAMHEIWVSSSFLVDTFSRTFPNKTIRLLPLPIPAPKASGLTRSSFGIPEHRLAVLVAFDLQSGWARKNPEGAVAAFRQAFPEPDRAQLVLKVTGGSGAPAAAAKLRDLISDMPNVTLIDRFLPAADLSALIRCCDTLLSLHRAEGLGLFLAEAMWLGVPVVATGWSGSQQLLDSSHAMLVRFAAAPVMPGEYFWVPPGATWAEPDIDHAADCLRRLAGDPTLRSELARLGQEKAKRDFDGSAFRAAIGPIIGRQPRT